MNDAKVVAKHNLTLAYILSIVIGILMTGVSLIGLFDQGSLYPTEELRVSFVANDIINLLIGIPILLGSMWWARRGWLVGLLFWPGSLFYVVYNYIAYVFGIPLGGFTFIYLVLVLLSAFIIFYLLECWDLKSIQEQLTGVVPVKTAGWYLILFGAAFLIRVIVIIFQAVTQPTPLPASELGVLIADLVLSPVWIAGGVQLLRRKPLGTASGLGLLFSGSMLFIGLIIVLLLQPVLKGGSLPWVDVIVVSIMAVICSIPFFLYLRGTLSKRISP